MVDVVDRTEDLECNRSCSVTACVWFGRTTMSFLGKYSVPASVRSIFWLLVSPNHK